MPDLRQSLASYLNRVRGTCAEPDDMVISTGFAQGFGLLCKVLAASGAKRLAIEDPSDAETRSLVRATGLEVVGIPVDESGMRVEMLDAARVDAVLVTSAHQYPTGAVLHPDRRTALVAWAIRRNGIIVEDDYDAEFRYDREPIGAIQGLAPDRVVYGGSASKILAPGLRLGWLLVPPALVDPMARAKKAADLGSSALDQLAFADFVSRGELDRHLRRMRPIYRRRRDALLAALRANLPELRPIGASAGLHVLAWLPDDIDEATVLARAADSGVAISGVTARRIDSIGPGGLVFGYAAVTEKGIEKGVRLLADAIRGAGSV
jgi:GntR family transcriptional regulator/MocR family aminotransferase